jgi:predicted transcriptional regulator
LPIGTLKLSEELHLSRQVIRTSLNRLKSTNEITIKPTNKFSIFTIINWDTYQNRDFENNQQVNQQVTNNQPHPTTKQPEPNKIPIIPLTPSAMSLPITPEDMGSSTTEASGNSAANDPQGMTTMYHKKNNRIDYAATVEDAYEDLGKILGGDGVKRLTDDTQRLMGQQMQLADAMKSMTPLLEQAKTMLQGFDLKNLDGLASMAKQLSGSSTTPQ